MNDVLLLVLGVCGAVLVIGLVLLVLGFTVFRSLIPGLLDMVNNAGGIFESDEPAPRTSSRTGSRRARLRKPPEPLDFEAALARHRNEPPPAGKVTIEAQHIDSNRFGVNTSTPISGRIMRDGRYRRVTGGTPGRERDQDFRRVDGSGPSVQADLPPAPKPERLRRRKRRDTRNEDEIFGGMLDEDGDGNLDF